MKITVKTVESATAEFEVTEEVGRWHKMAAVEGGTELMPFSLFSPSQMTVEDLKVEISQKMVSNVIPNACLNGLTDNYYISYCSQLHLRSRGCCIKETCLECQRTNLAITVSGNYA